MIKVKSSTSAEGNHAWWQAMNGPFAEEYMTAACIEIKTLEKMDVFQVTDGQMTWLSFNEPGHSNTSDFSTAQ